MAKKIITDGHLLFNHTLHLPDGTKPRSGQTDPRWEYQRRQRLKMPDRLYAAIEELTRRFPRALSSSEAAIICAMSPWHFSRQFGNIFGMSWVEFVSAYRIGRSKQLLERMPNAKLGDVAQRCGFDDAGYFARVFKQIEGVPPSTFRATVKDEE